MVGGGFDLRTSYHGRWRNLQLLVEEAKSKGLVFWTCRNEYISACKLLHAAGCADQEHIDTLITEGLLDA